ncbi:cytochrome P450 71A1-like [Pyrus ussuriensis x Pyrus communis]|uniref:Cytochrome P450 71A1-like n=1 Tax=Pyrus ussuriensis x Pyrus communis TaxID=2448454 RepID=A0A5N5I2C5_9ROSA|nr:phenylacetaldehyde oxime monooxygenase CYP71AN24-like [Pyrus x bretschneideri]KAB2633283.1 cytochrome P450 71A1-like [Pyrus ussuriensis x Pyrus communis]
MKCVIKENLRLHPPAPLLIPHESTADVKLGGYDIPTKTRVMVGAFSIQKDPKVWDRPEEFLLERFEDSYIDFKGQDFQLIPFGSGRRGAWESPLGLFRPNNILYWFDWKLPSTSGSELPAALDMTEVYGLTVRKKAHLVLEPVAYSP